MKISPLDLVQLLRVIHGHQITQQRSYPFCNAYIYTHKPYSIWLPVSLDASTTQKTENFNRHDGLSFKKTATTW